MVKAGRERKRGGWLPSFLGLWSMPGGIPAPLGKHPRPGAWRTLGVGAPPVSLQLSGCMTVCVCWGGGWGGMRISPLTRLFLIRKLWGRLMGQWEVVHEARRPRS